MLIVADKTQSQLLQEAKDDPSLKDCRFPIVIVSNKYKQQLKSFVGHEKETLTVSIYPLVSSEKQRDRGNCQYSLALIIVIVSESFGRVRWTFV